MKKVLILAALLCGTSFASMAAGISSPTDKLLANDVAFTSEVSALSPKILRDYTFTANGHYYLVMFDDEIEGDLQAAMTAAVAYAAGGGGTPGCYGGHC